MIAFIIVQAIISAVLGTVWSSSSWLNVFIKIALCANAVWSVYLIFEQKFGSVVLESGMRLM